MIICKRKWTASLLAIVLFIGSINVISIYPVYAEASAEGYCGYSYLYDEDGNSTTVKDTTHWKVEGDVLTLSFDNRGYEIHKSYMDDNAAKVDYPWSHYSSSIRTVIIETGVYIIPTWAFNNFECMDTIIIEKGLGAVHYGAFARCSNLNYVFYTGTSADWSNISINRGRIKLSSGWSNGIDFNAVLANARIHYNSRTHDWISQGILERATCANTGRESFKCIVCGETKTETIPVVEHIWNKEYTVDEAATYDSLGSKSIHCSVCNVMKEDSSVSIPKLTVKATILYKPIAAKKAVTVKWKKLSNITGYEIQYALNSKFTKSKKTINIAKAGTTNKKITNLKSKKKYYVRVRTYKIYKGKKYYSKWSKTKAVTTK